MLLIKLKMTSSIVGIQKPLNNWMDNYISPGRVGSVGDTHLRVRLKQSNPEMSERFYPWTDGKYESRLGSNVQDGLEYGYDNSGLMARVIDENWNTRRTFKTSHGWMYQDMRAPDRRVEPFVGAAPQYSWLNQVATIYNAKSTGNKFMPAPGAYAPEAGAVPRGGLIPRLNPMGDTSLITSSVKGSYTPRNPVVFT
jgi:hypothetical protein